MKGDRYDRIKKMIKTVSPADVAKVDDHMRVVQAAFQAFDERVEDLREPLRQKARAVMAQMLLRMLYPIHITVENLIVDEERETAVENALSPEHLKDNLVERYVKLASSYEALTKLYSPIF